MMGKNIYKLVKDKGNETKRIEVLIYIYIYIYIYIKILELCQVHYG